MSNCPSSAYNSQPFSQSQKISIGIVVDSVAPHPTKDGKFSNTHAVAEKEASNARRLTVKHTANHGVKAVAANMTIKHTDQFKKRASSSATASSLHGVQPTHSVQTAPNEPLLGHGVSRKRDANISSQKDGKMSGTDGRSENISSVRNHAFVSFKEVPQEQTGGMETISKETLRMKLRQILGTNPFSYDKADYAETLDVSTHGMTQEQNAEVDHHSKPKQNSDTIETDSENASLATKRPVTRSNARNKAPTVGRTRNSKPKSLSCDKDAKQGNSISSSAKKYVASQSCAVNHGRSMTERTDGAKKSCGIKPSDLHLPIKDLKNIQPVVTGIEKSTPAKELPVRSATRTPPPRVCSNENIEVTMQNVNLTFSPAISEKHQPQDSENPVPQEKSEYHESFGFQTPAPQEEHDDGSDCPLFEMRKYVLSSPMSLFPVNNNKKQHVHGSPHEAGPSILEDKSSSMSSSATENDSDSSDHTATPDDRYANAQDLSIDEKDADNGLFTPGKGESDSTQEVSFMKRVYVEDIQTSSEIGLVEKPIFSLNKRRRSQDVDFDDFSPAFTIPKASGKMDDTFMEASEGNADDELSRVISLLGFALEKVKSKMALATNRRCLDILTSASEEIHSKLQDVESQIQTDLRKLTNLKTSKRKHLETMLQEQQEHLKVIHEKFKEEIQMYLQDCRGAVEGLESQHVELKGAVETQKASHRKVVLQAEAAVENHIVDTQRKIMSIHKMGKRKMQQLKVVVGECLKDVISG